MNPIAKICSVVALSCGIAVFILLLILFFAFPPMMKEQAYYLKLQPPTAFAPAGAPSAPDSTPLPVDEAVAAMPQAKMEFVTPMIATVGSSFCSLLVVNADKPSNRLVPTNLVVGKYEAKVSPIMEATLAGTGFTIVPITPKKQAISASHSTIWSWQVMPTVEGVQQLDVSLSAILTVEGGRAPYVVETLHKDIDVGVAPPPYVPWDIRLGAFFDNNWQWFASTLFIPLFVWWYSSRKKHKKHPKKGIA